MRTGQRRDEAKQVRGPVVRETGVKPDCLDVALQEERPSRRRRSFPRDEPDDRAAVAEPVEHQDAGEGGHGDDTGN